MHKKFLISIAVITIPISCHKNRITPTAENLEGTWKYIGYSGGFIAVEFMPANTETYLQFHGTNYLKNSPGVQNCGSFSLTKDANTNYIGLITYDTSGLYSAIIINMMLLFCTTH